MAFDIHRNAVWEAWLDAPIDWGLTGSTTRRKAIVRFVKYGLIPFLESNGYYVSSAPRTIGSGIARLLFANEGLSCLETTTAPANNDAYPEEHMHRYYHVIDGEKWDTFWNEWGVWTGVDEFSSRGFDRRIEIQEFCWTQIDLEKSPQTQVVEEFLYYDETAVRQEFVHDD